MQNDLSWFLYNLIQCIVNQHTLEDNYSGDGCVNTIPVQGLTRVLPTVIQDSMRNVEDRCAVLIRLQSNILCHLNWNIINVPLDGWLRVPSGLGDQSEKFR